MSEKMSFFDNTVDVFFTHVVHADPLGKRVRRSIVIYALWAASLASLALAFVAPLAGVSLIFSGIFGLNALTIFVTSWTFVYSFSVTDDLHEITLNNQKLLDNLNAISEDFEKLHYD